MPARKKDPSTRARKNRASTASSLSTVVPIRQRPALPKRLDEDGADVAWHPATIEWWKDMWAAPMATEYHTSDRHQLFLLAQLVDDFWKSGSATARKEAAVEIRLQRQSFGLTPYDRRRLEWTIEIAEAAQERGNTRRAAAASTRKPPAQDPRHGLSLA